MNETASTVRRPDGVTILAIWYLVLGAGAGFGACATLIPAGIISVADDMPAGGRLIASLLLGLGLSITVLMFAVCMLVAWGLWNLKDWARIAALVLALIHLPFFPMGTVIGGATLWYLTSHPEGQAAFR